MKQTLTHNHELNINETIIQQKMNRNIQSPTKSLSSSSWSPFINSNTSGFNVIPPNSNGSTINTTIINMQVRTHKYSVLFQYFLYFHWSDLKDRRRTRTIRMVDLNKQMFLFLFLFFVDTTSTAIIHCHYSFNECYTKSN